MNANGSLPFNGSNTISVTDTADSGNNDEQLKLSVNDGTLTLVPTSGSQVSGSGSPSLTISGTLLQVNADLPNLVYSPTLGQSGSDTMTVTVLDTTDQVQGTSAQVSITINSVAATPTITTTPGGTVLVGSGSRMTDSATISGGDNPTGTITFAL